MNGVQFHRFYKENTCLQIAVTMSQKNAIMQPKTMDQVQIKMYRGRSPTFKRIGMASMKKYILMDLETMILQKRCHGEY